jgi:hypothetical protein
LRSNIFSFEENGLIKKSTIFDCKKILPKIGSGEFIPLIAA